MNQESGRGYSVHYENIKTNPELFLKTKAPYRDDIVIAIECPFLWYWIADFCMRENISFVLGHVLYMKAIH